MELNSALWRCSRTLYPQVAKEWKELRVFAKYLSETFQVGVQNYNRSIFLTPHIVPSKQNKLKVGGGQPTTVFKLRVCAVCFDPFGATVLGLRYWLLQLRFRLCSGVVNASKEVLSFCFTKILCNSACLVHLASGRFCSCRTPRLWSSSCITTPRPSLMWRSLWPLLCKVLQTESTI